MIFADPDYTNKGQHLSVLSTTTTPKSTPKRGNGRIRAFLLGSLVSGLIGYHIGTLGHDTNTPLETSYNSSTQELNEWLSFVLSEDELNKPIDITDKRYLRLSHLEGHPRVMPKPTPKPVLRSNTDNGNN